MDGCRQRGHCFEVSFELATRYWHGYAKPKSETGLPLPLDPRISLDSIAASLQELPGVEKVQAVKRPRPYAWGGVFRKDAWFSTYLRYQTAVSVIPAPQTRAAGATFVLRVPLPRRFSRKYDPANRPESTPTLLKPRERVFTKSRRPKPASEPKPKLPKQVSPPGIKEAPEEQREREGSKQPQPEHREASRRAARGRRERAKELGLCRDCRGQAIPNQTPR